MQSESTHPTTNPSPSLLTGLAMVGGAGVIITVLVLALGAAGVLSAEDGTIRIGILLGLMLLVVGVGGWVIAVQPYRHFDDITIAAPDDHAHAADDHADDHAADDMLLTAVVPHPHP